MPSDHKFAYINRKNFHSINGLVACDAQMHVEQPKTHKSYSMGMKVQAGRVQDQVGFLVSDAFKTEIIVKSSFKGSLGVEPLNSQSGDSSSPLKTWLLTTNPRTPRGCNYCDVIVEVSCSGKVSGTGLKGSERCSYITPTMCAAGCIRQNVVQIVQNHRPRSITRSEQI